MNSQQSTKVAALSTTAIDYVFQKYNKGSEGGLLIAAVALKRGRENQLRSTVRGRHGPVCIFLVSL